MSLFSSRFDSGEVRDKKTYCKLFFIVFENEHTMHTQLLNFSEVSEYTRYPLLLRHFRIAPEPATCAADAACSAGAMLLRSAAETVRALQKYVGTARFQIKFIFYCFMPFKRRVAPPSDAAGARKLPAYAAERATVVAHLGMCSRHTIVFLDFQLTSAGATNSGKTYYALQFLLQRAQASVASEDGDCAAGAFVYAGPLRMLAREVYDELCRHLSPEYVGLITAEEQINASARVLSCVAECAPLGGDTLVLDEVH
jgi:hypothetical protein